MKKASYLVSEEIYKEIYYIYDENGNLTAKGNEVESDGTGGLTLVKDTASSIYWEYEYSADNRLKAAYYKGELKAEYSYDADGKRIVSDTEEGTTYFVFNYAGKAIFEENVAGSTTKQTSFIYALSKQIARVEGVIGGDGELIYYHHDNLGSTRLMTNSAGEVVFDQDYLPFGGDLAVVGDIEPKNDVGESYKYTGQREEVSIGLYYYGARFYDPELGRFITEDTYVGELVNPNIYIYVLNNPMKYVDPSGNVPVSIPGDPTGISSLFSALYSDETWRSNSDNLMTQIYSAVKGAYNKWKEGPGSAYFEPYGFQLDGSILSKNEGIPLKSPIKPWREEFPGNKPAILEPQVESFPYKDGLNIPNITGGFDPLPEWLTNPRLPFPLDKRSAEDSIMMSEEVRTKGWSVGDPINNLTRQGNYPSWSTVKGRYWKNKANLPNSIKKYSTEDLNLMKKGRAPLHDEIKVPKELHHKDGRAISDPHNIGNLQELWPWEHDAIDPFRHYKGPKP